MSKFIEFNTYQDDPHQCSKCGRWFARFKDAKGRCYCAQCAGEDPTLFGKCYYGNNREDLYTIARHECRGDAIEDGDLLQFDQELRLCDPKKYSYRGNPPERKWYIVEHKFDWDWDSEWDEGILEVKYCPFCGKKLEGLNEDSNSKRNVENSSNKAK